MGLRVHQLPDQMLMALELSLRKSASSMKDNDIIQVFYGLALLKFRWAQHLTAETKEVLSIAVYNKAIKWQADTQVVLLVLYSIPYTVHNNPVNQYVKRSKALWKWLRWSTPYPD